MPEPFTLAAYDQLLRGAIDAGYELIGYGSVGAEPSERTCLLRHDVDAELMQCDRMARLERSLGVRSTYFLMTRATNYNLFSIEGMRVVEQLLALGHEIGLHFMGELMRDRAESELVASVLDEVAWVEREFPTKLSAVSFHQPTRDILERDLRIGNLVNTYNRTQLHQYFYVSDTNMQWRHEHPLEIFSRRLHPRIQLLIHPIWWTESPLPVTEKWLEALRSQNAAVIAHWEQRERTLQAGELSGRMAVPRPEGRVS